MLPTAQAHNIPFSVNGALDPALASLFGAAPRWCNETSLSRKMIRAVEPERTESGFLGRSTCTRADMDIRHLIAAGMPAVRHKSWMTHKELSALDALRSPWIQRDNVRLWPTPYAYQRTISLPVLLARPPCPSSGNTKPRLTNSQLMILGSKLATMLSHDGRLAVQVLMQHWYPRSFPDIDQKLLPLVRAEGIVLIADTEFAPIDFAIFCAALFDCEMVDVSNLLHDTSALRDPDVLNTALARQRPLPAPDMILRDILRERTLKRAGIVAHPPSERRFKVTWYDARTALELN